MYYCEGMFTSPLTRNRSLLLRGADHIENTSTVLLTACVCWTVYRAVAWQRVDQICYNITIFLGDFNAEVGKENIFKPTIGNESFHEISGQY
jgi:hypothetical protein